MTKLAEREKGFIWYFAIATFALRSHIIAYHIIAQLSTLQKQTIRRLPTRIATIECSTSPSIKNCEHCCQIADGMIKMGAILNFTRIDNSENDREALIQKTQTKRHGACKLVGAIF